jgi:hypothetical protein
MSEHDPYTVYVRTFGKITSGGKLANGDYGYTNDNGDYVAYGPEAQAAMSLAAQDVKTIAVMRPKSEVQEELRRLLK